MGGTDCDVEIQGRFRLFPGTEGEKTEGGSRDFWGNLGIEE